LDSVGLAGIKKRFGENRTEALEWWFQCILLAFVTPHDVGQEVRRQARDDLRAIIECLKETHGPLYGTTIQMATLLVEFAAMFDLQEARTQLADLQKRATKYLGTGHVQVLGLADLKTKLNARATGSLPRLAVRGPAPATAPPPAPASSSRHPAAEATRSRGARVLKALTGSSSRKSEPGHFPEPHQQERPVTSSSGRQRDAEDEVLVPSSLSNGHATGQDKDRRVPPSSARPRRTEEEMPPSPSRHSSSSTGE